MGMISEDMKSKYDVIGEKKNGKVVVIHNSGVSSAKTSYDSVYEFTMDMQKLSVNGIVVESING